MSRRIDRRTCVLGLAALGAVRPVQAAGLPVVGFLRTTPAAPFAHLEEAFRKGLSEGGYVDGQSVAVERRYADNDLGRLPRLATELIALAPGVIVANSQAAEALRQRTRSIPVVFVTSDDPVTRGLAESLARPGGNLTGITFFGGGQLGGKRVDLLREMLPASRRIGLLLDPAWPASAQDRSEAQAAAGRHGVDLVVAEASDDAGLTAAIGRLRTSAVEGVVVGGCPFFTSRRTALSAALNASRLPAIFDVRDFVEAGGLMSYGASLSGAWFEAGLYAARILRGADPATMPVTRPSQLELAVNQSTARALGLAIPAPLLARVDEMIE
ncbi:ABC transporter substrate-binding protein [Alsobacter sp. R-9]